MKRLDHVNVLAADVRANREFAQELLGYRLYERIELDDGTEAGAWLSLSIAAHELIYVADAYGAHGRLHHLAFWVDTREECLRAADLFVDNDVYIEAAPSKHAVAQGFFLYGYEPGGNRIEVTTGGYFVYDPDFEPITWTSAERARGQFWGVQTIESFHTYGTPDVDARRDVAVRGPALRAAPRRRRRKLPEPVRLTVTCSPDARARPDGRGGDAAAERSGTTSRCTWRRAWFATARTSTAVLAAMAQAGDRRRLRDRRRRLAARRPLLVGGRAAPARPRASGTVRARSASPAIRRAIR